MFRGLGDAPPGHQPRPLYAELKIGHGGLAFARSAHRLYGPIGIKL